MSAQILQGILTKNRRSLAKAITLVESTQPVHRQQATELLTQIPIKTNALRLGLCGAPGAGKSTLIEQLGLFLISQGKNPAVLAMDPSSTTFGGSILGDKTRMPKLGFAPEAYVRPSPTRGALGGITATTCESIQLCEAAGYDPIIIETVGLGQNETTIDDVSDIVLLVTSPAGGDALQGIKKGIMEVADLIAINKAEEPWLNKAKNSKMELDSAISLNMRRYENWIPRVNLISALNNVGIDKLWETVEKCRAELKQEIMQKRKKQQINNAKMMLDDLISRRLQELRSSEQYRDIVSRLGSHKILPRMAAIELLDILHKI